MNRGYTADLRESGFETENFGTEYRDESQIKEINLGTLSRFVGVAGLALFLTASPVTAIPDFWAMEKRRREGVVTIAVYRAIIGRPISRSEALWTARQILEKAERERLAYSELEASRGIQWGD